MHHPALPGIPLQVHGRYTRIEILAAVGEGEAAKTPQWREGVYDAKGVGADLLAFTLDKTSGEFSPTTRYRDYAISPRARALGEPVRDARGQPDRAPLPKPRGHGAVDPAVRSRTRRRSSVLVPRSGDLRLAREREANGSHVEASDPLAGRLVRYVRRRCGLAEPRGATWHCAKYRTCLMSGSVR